MKRLKKSFRKFFEKIFEKYFLDLSTPTLPQQIKHLPLYRHKGNEPALSYKNNQDNACYDKQKICGKCLPLFRYQFLKGI